MNGDRANNGWNEIWSWIERKGDNEGARVGRRGSRGMDI